MKYVWLVAAIILCYTTNLAFADEPKGLISFSQHKDYATYDLTKEGEWNTFEIIGKYKNSDPPMPDQTFIAQYRVINGTLESIKGDDTTVVAKVNTTDTGWFELKFPRNFPYKNTEIEDVELFIGINGYGSDVYYLPETTPMMEHVREKILNKINRPPPHPHTYSEKTDCFFVFQIPFYTYAEITIVYGWNGLIEKPYHGDQVPEHCVQETTSAQYHSSENDRPVDSEDNVRVAPEILWDVHEVILDGTIVEYDSRTWTYHIKIHQVFKGSINSDLISAEGFDVVNYFKKGDRALFYIYDISPVSTNYKYKITDYSVKTSPACDARSLIQISPTLPNENPFVRGTPTISADWVDPCVPEYFSYDPDFFNFREPIAPLKQLKHKIPLDKIRCYDDNILLFKNSNNSPACVKLETKAKLVERGWAKADIR